MSLLDSTARDILEENIDGVLERPEEFEQGYRKVLREMGVEPNLETVLSFISGFLQGLIWDYYLRVKQRNMNPEEIADLTKLMKRRAWELRHAFLLTRVE